MDLGEEFQLRVRRRLGEELVAAGEEFRAIDAEMASRGLRNSGPRIRKLLTAIEERRRTATDWAFGEVARLPGKASAHREEWFPFLTTELTAFFNQAFEAARVRQITNLPAGAAAEIDRQRAVFAAALEGDLREFRAGLYAPRAPTAPAPSTHNTVHVHGTVHGPIQQAGAGSHQEATVTINHGSVGVAVSTRTGMRHSRSSLFMQASTVNPSMTGMLMSRMTPLGCRLRI